MESFFYLGVEIHNTGSSEPEVRRRPKAALTSRIEGSGVPVSRSPQKFNYIYRTYIQPVLRTVYGSETWALTRALQHKVDAFDNICLRRIFRIPYMDNVTNTTV